MVSSRVTLFEDVCGLRRSVSERFVADSETLQLMCGELRGKIIGHLLNCRNQHKAPFMDGPPTL